MKSLKVKLGQFPSSEDFLPFKEYINKNIEFLQPAYFAMVMATGIVSISSKALGLQTAANILFWINIVLYLSLWALLATRILFFTSSFLKDCRSHLRGPGFFTLIAANSIVGSQFSVIRSNFFLAEFLFWVSICLWVLITYSIFLFLIIEKKKPSLDKGMNGGWLVSIVATQSITVLGCLVGDHFSTPTQLTFFILMSFWLCGGMLYIWIISIIFYRYMFFSFDPKDLMPPYWINMGAAAISTLSGALLIQVLSHNGFWFKDLLPFIKGFTLMYWATATWWVPMLLILGIWRHYFKQVEFKYDPLYWGLVFPLGMYSISTLRLYEYFGAPDILIGLSKTFAVIALLAWFITFSGVAKRILYVPILFIQKEKLR